MKHEAWGERKTNLVKIQTDEDSYILQQNYAERAKLPAGVYNTFPSAYRVVYADYESFLHACLLFLSRIDWPFSNA